jgi:hypothetical protein
MCLGSFPTIILPPSLLKTISVGFFLLFPYKYINYVSHIHPTEGCILASQERMSLEFGHCHLSDFPPMLIDL